MRRGTGATPFFQLYVRFEAAVVCPPWKLGGNVRPQHVRAPTATRCSVSSTELDFVTALVNVRRSCCDLSSSTVVFCRLSRRHVGLVHTALLIAALSQNSSRRPCPTVLHAIKTDTDRPYNDYVDFPSRQPAGTKPFSGMVTKTPTASYSVSHLSPGLKHWKGWELQPQGRVRHTSVATAVVDIVVSVLTTDLC